MIDYQYFLLVVNSNVDPWIWSSNGPDLRVILQLHITYWVQLNFMKWNKWYSWHELIKDVHPYHHNHPPLLASADHQTPTSATTSTTRDYRLVMNIYQFAMNICRFLVCTYSSVSSEHLSSRGVYLPINS